MSPPSPDDRTADGEQAFYDSFSEVLNYNKQHRCLWNSESNPQITAKNTDGRPTITEILKQFTPVKTPAK